jgi:membrane protein YdbS with pleckstrin-like domain
MLGAETVGSYVDSTLNEGEIGRYDAKISLWSLAGWIILGILTITIFIGFLFLLIAFLKWWSTEIAITNRKIVAKYGFISRNTVEILLTKIESIQVHQGIFGRIFNYGTLVVSGSGLPQAPIKGISDPMIFRRRFVEIQEQASR